MGDALAFELLINKQKVITKDKLTIKFLSLIEDSRCPTDVTCVWQGNAELMLVVGPAAGAGPAELVPLNTVLEPRSGSALGLKLSLLNLTPVPVSTTPTKGYQAEIRIERTPAS